MNVISSIAAQPAYSEAAAKLLRRVPALRVLRRDLDPVEPGAWIVAVTALVLVSTTVTVLLSRLVT